MKTAILASLVASAAAFAPTKQATTSTALKAFEDELGTYRCNDSRRKLTELSCRQTSYTSCYCFPTFFSLLFYTQVPSLLLVSSILLDLLPMVIRRNSTVFGKQCARNSRHILRPSLLECKRRVAYHFSYLSFLHTHSYVEIKHGRICSK
jgi:hypothetical protein